MKALHRYILSLAVAMTAILAQGEEKPYSLDWEYSQIIVGQDTLTQDIAHVTNTGQCNIWILLSDDTDCSDKDLFRKRFIAKHDEASMPMIQWILDHNVNWDNFINHPYEDFFKILAPGQDFYITFLTKGELGIDPEIIIGDIRILWGADFGTWQKKVESIQPTTQPSYQYNVITLPIQ